MQIRKSRLAKLRRSGKDKALLMIINNYPRPGKLQQTNSGKK